MRDQGIDIEAQRARDEGDPGVRLFGTAMALLACLIGAVLTIGWAIGRYLR